MGTREGGMRRPMAFGAEGEELEIAPVGWRVADGLAGVFKEVMRC